MNQYTAEVAGREAPRAKIIDLNSESLAFSPKPAETVNLTTAEFSPKLKAMAEEAPEKETDRSVMVKIQEGAKVVAETLAAIEFSVNAYNKVVGLLKVA